MAVTVSRGRSSGQGSTFWVIPSEVTTALQAVREAFGGSLGEAKPPQESKPAQEKPVPTSFKLNSGKHDGQEESA